MAKAARDAGNTQQNKRIERLMQRRDQDDDEALKVVLRTEDGRRVLCRLARDFTWRGDVWDANSERQTSFNAGLQGAAHKMMRWAESVAPAEFLTALSEATRRDVDLNTLTEAATIEKDEDDNG